jgi:phage-related protein
MGDHKFREVILYKRFFSEFIEKLILKNQEKIIWTIKLIETQEVIPAIFLKFIEGTNGLYEVRVQCGNNAFRVFCFFDAGRRVVLINGFQKKTQKTPRIEIVKALKIKKDYENEK